MMKLFIVALGVTSLLSGCFADRCPLSVLLERKKRCMTIPTQMTDKYALKSAVRKYCVNMEDNIACEVAAYGDDCSGHLNVVGSRVVTEIMCADPDRAVNAMFGCMSENRGCSPGYGSAVQAAASRYLRTDDVSRFRADMCAAYPIFERGCMPFPQTSYSCPSPDFAQDLFKLSLAGAVCTDRDFSSIYRKYGFSADGVKNDKVSYKYEGHDIDNEKIADDYAREHHTEVIGHGATGFGHMHVIKHVYKISGASNLTMSVTWMLIAIGASLLYL